MPDDGVCRQCGRSFRSRRDNEWCSDRCAAAGWKHMHPNVPVRRPGRRRPQPAGRGSSPDSGASGRDERFRGPTACG